MGIDHRGADILMSEEFLDGPDVVPVFKEMGPERMAERMATGGLGEPCFLDRLLHRLLQDGLMEMVSPFEAGTGIDVGVSRPERCNTNPSPSRRLDTSGPARLPRSPA